MKQALETFRDQDKEIYIEQDFTKPLKVSKYEAFSGFQSLLKLNGTVNNYTPNHADFFICISRPKGSKLKYFFLLTFFICTLSYV